MSRFDGRTRAAAGRVFALVMTPLVLACRQDMHDQPRYDPLEKSDFFRDGSSAQWPPEGTVPRDDPRLDRVLYSGIDASGGFVGAPPVPLDRALLLRGQERYGAFCSPCHGLTGDGNGMIVQRGFKRPPPLATDRLRAQPVGYFVDVITNGFGMMPAYVVQVGPRDRWAIAAFVRALQLSQNAPLRELPAEDATRIEALQ